MYNITSQNMWIKKRSHILNLKRNYTSNWNYKLHKY
jgi:hypothetical protein